MGNQPSRKSEKLPAAGAGVGSSPSPGQNADSSKHIPGGSSDQTRESRSLLTSLKSKLPGSHVKTDLTVRAPPSPGLGSSTMEGPTSFPTAGIFSQPRDQEDPSKTSTTTAKSTTHKIDTSGRNSSLDVGSAASPLSPFVTRPEPGPSDQHLARGSLSGVNEAGSPSQPRAATQMPQILKSPSSILASSTSNAPANVTDNSSSATIPPPNVAQPSGSKQTNAPSAVPSPSTPVSASKPGSASFHDPSRASGGPLSKTTWEPPPLKEINLDHLISRLLDAGYSGKATKSVCLKNAEILALCAAAREVFLEQPSLLELSAPVKIVGDVHGQYSDLLRMFKMCGFPPQSNFLFLGDYVDRGKKSLETILLLMCYKLKYPGNFFLLRGNHECASVTLVYGFYDECKRRCSTRIWKAFVDVFNTLPIAAIVASKIFCVHGGLSPSLTSMDDIRQISRPTDVPEYGLLNDLLWSDPASIDTDWESNERGVSYCFGKKVILDFLTRYDFDLVCRAHMVVEDGYEFFNDRILVTVFSAPNYCGEFDNWGAIMSVSQELLCSFELLMPLNSSALKSHFKKSKSKRQNMLISPPAIQQHQSV